MSRMSEAWPRRVIPACAGEVASAARTTPWPLHGIAASRRIEAATTATLPPMALMQRAGLATARLARAIAPLVESVDIWCGPGNNGGDGYIAARHLHQWGSKVHVFELGDIERLPADAAQARREALAAGVAPAHPQTGPEPATGNGRPGLVIDALLGLGASRAPADAIAAAIDAMQRRDGPVLAVDLPSALHAERGMPLDIAVKADVTLALLTLKPGLFTALGRDHAGEVWFDPLGVDPMAVVGGIEPDAWLAAAPPRGRLAHAAHKGSRGDVLVIGGAPGMTGAAWLAARAALAAGAGRVYLSTLAAAADAIPFDPSRPELMKRERAWTDRALLGRSVVVCGCGGGVVVREVLPEVLMHARQLVLDADGLNALAAEPALATLLAGRRARAQDTIVTPHPLEAARLSRCAAAEVQADRLQAAARLAQALGACVVLKGSGTVIASPGRAPRINPTGNAALASAGSGDVLAGWIGGAWAQTGARLPALAGPPEVAEAAVWLHGHAADVERAQPNAAPLLAADLVGVMQRLAL
jgi:hydroxyethylthiazole kinase-like uncharacterized protein yjeF